MSLNKISTTPRELASQGFITSIMSDGCWYGEIPLSSINGCNEFPKGKTRTLIPSIYFDNIMSLTRKRRILFDNYGIETVFGRFMTKDTLLSWSNEDLKIITKIKRTYFNMSIDRDFVVSNARKIGRWYSKKEWNKLHPESHEPSSEFNSEMEARLENLIPSQKSISSVRLWTDYYLPPPASLDPLDHLYKETFRELSYEFSSQVIAGLKSMINKSCNDLLSMVKKSGEVEQRFMTRLPNDMALIGDMYFIEDEETRFLIKSLQETPDNCYKDASKLMKSIEEVRSKSTHLLDCILVN